MSLFRQLFSLKERISLKERLLQLLFPRVCPVCGEILKLPPKWYHVQIFSANGQPFGKFIKHCHQILICPACVSKLNPVSEPACAKCSRPLDDPDDFYCDVCAAADHAFDAGAALWAHDDIARKIIYDLKFHNKRDNADLIGFEMALHLKEHLDLWNAEVLIPVPLHKKRLRERGFNQAQLIAEKLSFWLEVLYGYSLPVDDSYLLRSEKTKPQRTLKTSMRAKNVRGAFTVVGYEKDRHRSVILVDDIFTSGSTINACARALKECGSQAVFFVTASIV